MARGSLELAGVGGRATLPSFLLLVLCSTSAASAQWTVSVFAGGVRTLRTDVRVSNAGAGTDITFERTGFRSASLESPMYYGYRVGHSAWRRRLFLEGELIHAKAYAHDGIASSGQIDGHTAFSVPLASVVQSFAMSHGLNLLFVNAVVRHDVAGGRITFLGRAGIGPAIPHAETEISGRSVEGYQWTGPAYQVAAGVEIPVWRTLRASLEYKFTQARVRLDLDTTALALTPRSNHIAVGATWIVGGRS